MPNANLTEIVILLDRSGSMASIMDDMENGFKFFIEEQRKIPDPCVVSLYQFDNKHEAVFVERALTEVKELGLKPRGSTALLDAMGSTITSVGERLAAKPEEQRPGKVVFMIITDGHENASHEFKLDNIKQMVQKQTEIYKWQFAFLGANIDAFAEAQSLGISGAAVMNYASTTKGVQHMYKSNARAVGSYRISGADAVLSFTPEEQNANMSAKKTP